MSLSIDQLGHVVRAEPIVSAETFSKVQKLIEDRAKAQEQYERNRDPEQIEAERGCDEGCDCNRETTSAELVSDNRPTGQSELRRLPVSGTSEETRIAVRTTPRE